MTASASPQEATNQDVAIEGFTWHPTYAGKAFDRVERELTDDIARDQRAYSLAMDGAETSEHSSLIAVVGLEKRWSEYDFEWAAMDPAQLAARILRFEQVRERRQEMISFAEYRASGALIGTEPPPPPEPGGGLPIARIGTAILVILLVLFLASIML